MRRFCWVLYMREIRIRPRSSTSAPSFPVYNKEEMQFRRMRFLWTSYLDLLANKKHCLIFIESDPSGCSGSCSSLCLWLGGRTRLQQVNKRSRHPEQSTVWRSFTHRHTSLQTHVEIFLLIHFQFLQCHPGFPNKFIMPKLVFITDREPMEIKSQLFRPVNLSKDHVWYRSTGLWLSEAHYPPEGLTLHVLIRQAMIGERLIPHRIAGVSQGLCAQLVRLLDEKHIEKRNIIIYLSSLFLL